MVITLIMHSVVANFSLMNGYLAKSYLLCSIMLDAFKDQLCSKLCWHNRPGPSHLNILISYSE